MNIKIEQSSEKGLVVQYQVKILLNNIIKNMTTRESQQKYSWKIKHIVQTLWFSIDYLGPKLKNGLMKILLPPKKLEASSFFTPGPTTSRYLPPLQATQQCPFKNICGNIMPHFQAWPIRNTLQWPVCLSVPLSFSFSLLPSPGWKWIPRQFGKLSLKATVFILV